MDTLLPGSLADIAKYYENAERFADGEVEKCVKYNHIVNNSYSSMLKSNEISQTYINTENLYSQFANEIKHSALSLRAVDR